MNVSASESVDTRVPPVDQQQFQVWVSGTYTGSVWASDERDARYWAARLFLTTPREVRVLPVS